ncbi:hypothetical protein REPUB_Repub03eG0165500 [Reevesia pubescens]
MAETFLFNIAEKILYKISSSAVEELGLALGSESGLMKLKDTLGSVKAVLLDAEKQQQQNEELRLWLWKLKGILCDAEDVFDEFESEALSGKQREFVSKACCFASCSVPHFAFLLKMSHEIKRINERLDKVAADKDKFHLCQQQADSRRVIGRESHSFVNSSDIIGRDQDKEKLLNLLTMLPNEGGIISVIPITGFGGLGKTALAQLLYNDETVARAFQLRLWVCAADDFGLPSLLSGIIHSATRERCEGFSVDVMQARLQSILGDKRYLLILDDIWNEDPFKWNQLRELLNAMGDQYRSKIIVTTRSAKVASIMGTISPHELKGLSHDNCVSLFVKWAFKNGEERQHPNLLRIANEIVRKCKGVPLAVRTLGSLLYSKTDEHEWAYIRDNETWQLPQMENGILPILKLSFDHLPSHLQRCVAYCSLFPKDYVFESDYIFQFWMAYGFLESPRPNEEWEDVAFRYFQELWSRCFFQDYGEGYFFFTFKMHDLIHDLALLVSQKECSTVNLQTRVVDEEVRHLTFSDDDVIEVPIFLKKMKEKHVRTVLVPTTTRQYRSIDESFVNLCLSNFKYLRVLDMSYSGLKVLPKSIGTLKHLRFFDLTYSHRLSKLPNSISKLRNLLLLRLKGVQLSELPDNMERMLSLRYLEITTDARQLREIRQGGWCSLQYLYFYGCSCLKFLFEGMQHLTSLRTLFISNCARLVSLPRGLKFLTKLQQLVIFDCPLFNFEEDPDLHLNLQTFIVRRLPKVVALPQSLLEGSASTLKFVQVWTCSNLATLPGWLQNLTSLQKLDICECPNLLSLPDGMDHLIALQKLRIQGCPALSERCKREVGADWPKIAHVQELSIE